MIQFPSCRRPTVSVIVVTYGQWRWTQRALRALRDHTEGDYEVVIVDNASPDETPQRLADEVRGARVILNRANHGFGPGANQGAACALGRHLLFLNSDAMVRAGWLAPMLQSLEREDVAAVSPRLLNFDGSLQEAGAIVWRDGSVLVYGAGDDPWRAEYRFRRDIDYGSGACLMVRREAFAAVGGFDPAYAPAYFEDVDLCLCLAARGGRIVYEPRSVVVHAVSASSGSDRAMELYLRNLSTFSDRWAETLAPRPTLQPTITRRLALLGRDARAEERVLVVVDRIPDDDGLPALVGSVLASRWPSVRVTLLPSREPAVRAAAAPLENAGVEVADTGGDPSGWLQERSGHYGIVMLAALGAARALAQPLRRTQAAAARLLLGLPEDARREDLEGVEAVLCRSAAEVERADEALPAAFLARLPEDPSRRGGREEVALALGELLAHLGVSPPASRAPQEDIWPEGVGVSNGAGGTFAAARRFR
ncbi:MAG: hypothetical protein QOK40_2309 [Miltoncostaeaceae bacterium]|jgi:GT2 family glycosyltransferase|nr:hypothetical protein [Miltoncostaeaceae bacterium]